ncbi:MAG: YqaE/Pmp3 family membrane protein [Bacteroidota bacterium]
MMLLAILLPSVSFFFRGKIISAILCLLLQLTLIGWLPAAIWAVMSLSDARAEKRNRRLIKAIKTSRQ